MNSTGDPFSVNIPLTAPVPAFFIAVALVAGTLGCFTAGIVVALTAVGVLMAAAVLFRSKTAILLTIAALIGALNVQIHRVEVPAAIEYGQEQKFVGSIDEVTERDYGTFLTVTLDSIDGVLAAPRAKAAVTLLPDSSMLLNLSAGELIQFRGVASAPGSRLLLPDERNYDAENIRQGIAVSILSSDKRVTLRGDASGLMNAFRRLRTHFVEAILGADFSTGTATFLAACLAGDDSMVSPITRETFSITGLAHLLALSGTHVAIITLLFSLILIPLRAFGRRRLRAWLLIAALWFFALLTGLSPSVVRAVTMATVMLLARILERSVSPFQSLSVAAILIIIFDP
ncbi:MAG: ComEC/Rec2 family competence protein, partial [Muribaculaceae bacterium]|nr:ComEC/Rec2 family competence protein [Muribaculaceae bacterium]